MTTRRCSSPVPRRLFESPEIPNLQTSRALSSPSTSATERDTYVSDLPKSLEVSQIGSLTFDQLKSILVNSVKEAIEKKQAHIAVYQEIQNEVHIAISHLSSLDNNWDFSVSFNQGRNPDYTKQVLEEIGNRLGDFDRDMAYKASRTYFLTLKTKDKKIKNGTMEESRQAQRKRQRRSYARMRRSSMLRKMKSIPNEDKQKLESILETNDYMSSEESDYLTDSDKETKTKILIKKQIPWRSVYLGEWFSVLDKESEKRRKKVRKGNGNGYYRDDGEHLSIREQPIDAPCFAIY